MICPESRDSAGPLPALSSNLPLRFGCVLLRPHFWVAVLVFKARTLDKSRKFDFNQEVQ